MSQGDQDTASSNDAIAAPAAIVTTALTPPKPEEDARSVVEKLLGARVRCTLADGRTVSGRLVCVDRLKNLILADCLEERLICSRDYNPDVSVPPQTKVARRSLAQAMVPGRQLVRVEMGRAAFEARTRGATSASAALATAPPPAKPSPT